MFVYFSIVPCSAVRCVPAYVTESMAVSPYTVVNTQGKAGK